MQSAQAKRVRRPQYGMSKGVRSQSRCAVGAGAASVLFRRSVVVPVTRSAASRDTEEVQRKEALVTSIFMISSALEIGLVIAASAVFLAMVITALALIIWLVAGFVSASHP